MSKERYKAYQELKSTQIMDQWKFFEKHSKLKCIILINFIIQKDYKLN